MSSHIKSVSHSHWIICQMYKCERIFIYFIDIPVSVTVGFISCFQSCTSLLLPVRCGNTSERMSGSQRHAGELEGFSVAILPSICPSSGMNICGVAVFSHSRQFLYSFIKTNFTWMSDLICCHKQFRL